MKNERKRMKAWLENVMTWFDMPSGSEVAGVPPFIHDNDKGTILENHGDRIKVTTSGPNDAWFYKSEIVAGIQEFND